MGSEWRLVQIRDIAEKIAMGPFGSNIKVATFVDEGVPIISGAHLRGTRVEDGEFNFVTEEHAEKLRNSNVYRGDVIFTHAGSIGQVAYIPNNSRYERYVISQRQFYLRCDKAKADPAFITYFFHSPLGQHRLLANASQVGVPSISRPSSNLKEIEVELPSLSEQRAIVGAIGCLDDRIDLLRQTNTTLEAIAQALFKSWFVDFDPVHAKSEGREPEAMDAATATLFPSEFEQSELGPIPKGWHAGKLIDMAKLRGGKQLSRDMFTEDGQFPIFGGAGEMGRANVFNADGLVVTVGRVGAYCGQIFFHNGAAWVNNNASHVIPHPECLASTLWIFLALKNSDINRIKKGAAQPFVSNSDIEGLPLAIPGKACIDAFTQVAFPIFERVSQISEHVQCLTELRDTLLPRLISGKLRLPEAMEATQEALA